MAEIYKALDRRREQAGTRPHWVALKVVASADDRSPAAEALQREASLAARLDHPNIVRVFGLDRDGSHLFLAMELLAGESLAHRLDRRQQRPLPRLQVVPLIEALCRALAYLHGRGLVHGDIKPGNLFITADEQVKILDFGIARDLQAATPVTPRGRTAEYASCEVLAGEPPVPADDVYSVACVAYRMLAGHRPFGNQTAREAEVAGRRPAVIETLPAAQWQALERALSFRRAERPADLGQFIALFKGSRDEVEPPAPVAASAPPAATSEPPSQPPSQRWPFAGTWAAFVAICALGAAVVWVVPRHMPRQSTNPAPRQLLPPAPDPGAPAVAPQPAPPYDPVPAATDGAPAPRLVLPADEVPTDEG
jgi:serine/threonine protein kinase